MTDWHTSSKEKIRINPEELSNGIGGQTIEVPSGIQTFREASDVVEKSLEAEGGEIDRQTKVLFDAWESVGSLFLEQSRHMSTVKIARRMVDIMLASGAPAAPMVLLALAFKAGAERLMVKVKEINPALADEVEKDERK